jgi:hypothetical protein
VTIYDLNLALFMNKAARVVSARLMPLRRADCRQLPARAAQQLHGGESNRCTGR